jgi:hypothetical protein
MTGTLLLLGVVTALVSSSLAGTMLDAPIDSLAIASHQSQLLAAVLSQFLSAAVSACIAVALYPAIREQSRGLAIGAVAFRTFEAVFYAISAAAMLGLMALARGPASDPTYVASMSTILGVLRNSSNFVFGVLAFSIGAAMYYLALYRSKLIPRWLSAWGLAAIVPLVVAALLAFFAGDSFAIAGKAQLMAAPIALQEIVLGVWLITKGFDTAPSTSVRTLARPRIP